MRSCSHQSELHPCPSCQPLSHLAWRAAAIADDTKETGFPSKWTRTRNSVSFSYGEGFLSMLAFTPFRIVPDTWWACVCYSCRFKVAQTGRVKQQKVIFSKFWRLEIQHLDVSRVGSFRGNGILCHVNDHLLVCSHVLFTGCAWVRIS